MHTIANAGPAANDSNAAEPTVIFWPGAVRRRTPAVTSHKPYLTEQPIQWGVAAFWLGFAILGGSLWGWFIHAVVKFLERVL